MLSIQVIPRGPIVVHLFLFCDQTDIRDSEVHEKNRICIRALNILKIVLVVDLPLGSILFHDKPPMYFNTVDHRLFAMRLFV